MNILLRISTILCFVPSFVFSNEVIPTCDHSNKTCEYDFVVERLYTMAHYKTYGKHFTFKPLVSGADGKLHVKDCVYGQGTNITLSEEEAKDVNTVDGTYKQAMLINGKLPGPPLVVYEGQQIIVHVTNKMPEATTVHFHGMYQRGTPYMDGAGGISQCHINSGQTFTYNFTASPSGTHFYHAHEGSQMSMGMYGPFIVLPKPGSTTPRYDYDRDFFMVINEWFKDDTYALYLKDQASGSGRVFTEEDCILSSRQIDTVVTSTIPFHSALINGKGWLYDKTTNIPHNIHHPLEIFRVTEGEVLRFRIISVAKAFPLCISVDNHKLHVIATDGIDIEMETVDYIILTSAERYDFILEATDREQKGNYWIRVETLNYDSEEHPGWRLLGEHTEAILRYDGAPDELPTTSRKMCSEGGPCLVMNCLMKKYPDDTFMQCIHVTELRPAVPSETYPVLEGAFTETFSNFHFAYLEEEILSMTPTIGNIKNVFPTIPPQVAPETVPYTITQCDPEVCIKEFCECTNLVKYPLNTVVQMVWINTQRHTPGERMMNHYIHMHGHHFQVLKIGWPQYYENGTYKAENEDITCLKSITCHAATWTDESWLNGNVPGLTAYNPPQKDTVLVPLGGYTVIRIKTDNPGFWYVHCHVENHNLNGMSMIIQEGELDEIPTDPNQNSMCINDFNDMGWTCTPDLAEDQESRKDNHIHDEIERLRKKVDDDDKDIAIWVLSIICVLLVIIILILMRRQHHIIKSGQHKYVDNLDETSSLLNENK